MLKCSNASRYKGTRKPTCLGGKGCKVCREHWKKIIERKRDEAFKRIEKQIRESRKQQKKK